MIISYCQSCGREFEDEKKITLCKCGGVMFMYRIHENKIPEPEEKEDDIDSMNGIMDYYFSNGGNI